MVGVGGPPLPAPLSPPPGAWSGEQPGLGSHRPCPPPSQRRSRPNGGCSIPTPVYLPSGGRPWMHGLGGWWRRAPQQHPALQSPLRGPGRRLLANAAGMEGTQRRWTLPLLRLQLVWGRGCPLELPLLNAASRCTLTPSPFCEWTRTCWLCSRHRRHRGNGKLGLIATNFQLHMNVLLLSFPLLTCCSLPAQRAPVFIFRTTPSASWLLPLPLPPTRGLKT